MSIRNLAQSLALAVSLALRLHAGQPFAKDDVVVFLGDSITHGGKWHSYVEAYYLTRFPEQPVRFINAGFSGDSAGGALNRLDGDVLAAKPSAVVVMLGMNDVRRDLYKAGEPSEATLAGRQKAIEQYRSNMTRIVERLKADGVSRLLLISPSPFDQTSTLERENLPGVNDALVECGRIGKELASAHGGEWVDFNGPLTEWNVARQKTQPASTLVGADRVHPGAPGSVLMAYLFLRAQSAPALVARIAVDAARAAVVETSHAEARIAESGGPLFSFRALASALPFPVDPEGAEAAAIAPIERDLNQETIVVRGLVEGNYRFSIDGSSLGTHSAAALAKGIPVARPEAPQYRQALEVLTLVERRRQLRARLRDIALQDERARRAGASPDDREATHRVLDAYIAQLRASSSPYLSYWEPAVARYYRYRPYEQQYRREADVIGEMIDARRRPVWRLYEVEQILP